ncbi:unnamed protein product [Ectocarpus fasciculatus]
MPRRALPACVLSSSPSRLRCLAVLTAAWGSHGFRSISSGNGGTRVRAATAATNEVGEVQVEERPWLGNGPDPMASTGKARPGTSASLGAAAVGEAGGKGKGVAPEEMWLNGPFNAPVPPGPLEVLFVDDEIVVCNKPSDLLCVPGRIEKDSLATRAALELGHYRVDRMIVHRLDMATSGCVIMARTDAALKDLNRQFRERQVRKRYVAMVHGVLSADEGEVDLPLCRNRGCPPLHMVNFEHGKPSLTKWRVLDRAADRTRVELIPVSGRSHQLRLHMNAIGHPILGDHFYGTKDSLALADRCLLHAHTLCLRHPKTGERTMFTAPCEF